MSEASVEIGNIRGTFDRLAKLDLPRPKAGRLMPRLAYVVMGLGTVTWAKRVELDTTVSDEDLTASSANFATTDFFLLQRPVAICHEDFFDSYMFPECMSRHLRGPRRPVPRPHHPQTNFGLKLVVLPAWSIPPVHQAAFRQINRLSRLREPRNYRVLCQGTGGLARGLRNPVEPTLSTKIDVFGAL